MARHTLGPRRSAAVLNEVLQRRQRQRWSVLAQYALFDLVGSARLVWSGLLEVAGLAPGGELGNEALAAGWWGSVLDESEPLEDDPTRPRLSRISRATQSMGPVDDEWLRDNLVAIAQLAESLDRGSFDLALRIVPLDWWATQLPERPSIAASPTTPP
jgi:hypothetical protein